MYKLCGTMRHLFQNVYRQLVEPVINGKKSLKITDRFTILQPGGCIKRKIVELNRCRLKVDVIFVLMNRNYIYINK